MKPPNLDRGLGGFCANYGFLLGLLLSGQTLADQQSAEVSAISNNQFTTSLIKGTPTVLIWDNAAVTQRPSSLFDVAQANTDSIDVATSVVLYDPPTDLEASARAANARPMSRGGHSKRDLSKRRGSKKPSKPKLKSSPKASSHEPSTAPSKASTNVSPSSKTSSSQHESQTTGNASKSTTSQSSRPNSSSTLSTRKTTSQSSGVSSDSTTSSSKTLSSKTSTSKTSTSTTSTSKTSSSNTSSSTSAGSSSSKNSVAPSDTSSSRHAAGSISSSRGILSSRTSSHDSTVVSSSSSSSTSNGSTISSKSKSKNSPPSSNSISSTKSASSSNIDSTVTTDGSTFTHGRSTTRTTSTKRTASSLSSSGFSNSSSITNSARSSVKSSSTKRSSRSTSSATTHSSQTRSKSTTSSSHAACSQTSTGKTKPLALHRRTNHDKYSPPDQCATDKIVAQLKKYTDPRTRNELVNEIIDNYMHNSSPPADSAMFYIGPATEEAALQSKINDKETIETVYWGYSKGPFDPALQPMKDITKEGLQKQWFQATSAAFARVVSGKAFFIYDGEDYEDARGRDGLPSIFITDELPEMQMSGKTEAVYQICTHVASLYSRKAGSKLQLVDDLECATHKTGPALSALDPLPVKVIWEKHPGSTSPPKHKRS